MTNLKVNFIEENDVSDVLVINNLCFNPPWSLETLESEIKNKFSKYIVLKQDDKVIGYAGIWLIIDEAHITSIAIHPNFRNFGYGSLLLNEVLKLCNEFVIPSITLEVGANNTAAKNLYKKFGFIEEGIRKNYYEDNEDAIIMWKKDVLNSNV